MTAAMRLEDPMIVEQLAEVSAQRANADTKPVRDAVDRVRQALDKYERSAVDRAQRRLTRVMLEAIGHSGELTSKIVAEHESEEAEALRAAMAELSPLIAPPSVPAVLCVVPPPPPSSEAAPPETARDAVAPPSPAVEVASTDPTLGREATAEEIVRVEAVINEIEALDTSWSAQPRERLTHHLKAVAAEMRHLLMTFPRRHVLRWKLEKMPQKLHCICRDSGVVEFINGVGSNTKGNWEAIAQRERRAVAMFDQNASRPAQASPPKSKTHQSRSSSVAKLGDVLGPKLSVVLAEPAPLPSSDADATRWPRLRELLGGKKLMIVGGVARPERARTIEARTGIVVEWEAIDKNAPRQVEGVVRRLEGGSVAACLVAEGVMAHKDYRRIEAACRAGRNRAAVLFAFCHRGGGAQIDDALDSLEKRLTNGR